MKFVRNYLRTPKRPFSVNLKRLFPNFKKKKERKKERKKKKKSMNCMKLYQCMKNSLENALLTTAILDYLYNKLTNFKY